MWPCPELDEVVHIRTGTINPLKYPEMEFELFSIPGFDIGSPEIKVGSEILSNKNVVKPDDVLFSKLNPRIPRIWIVPKSKHRRQISSTEFWPLVCDQRLLSNHYLRYFLLKLAKEGVFSDSIEAATRSRSRIKPFHLLRQHIPLPPLSEQRRIVEILDQADALRKKRAVADAKAARILPALFYKMFGDPATNPKGWPKKHLSDLCAQVTDGTHDTPKPTSSGYPLVTNAHFINGYIDFSQTYNISPEDHAAVIARSKPEYGDVLYSQIGSLGTACFVDTDREFSIKNCALFKPNPQRLSGKWLTALLNTESYKTYVLKQASGGLQKYLSLKVLRGLDVIAPPIAEQAQFDRAYDSVLALAERREESAILVNKLFNSILHRAFTGDLTAKWREAHMKELLQEMEQQAKALKIDDFRLPIEGDSKSSIINHRSEIPHD